VSHGSQDKVLETHGLALQEAISYFASSSEERKKFKSTLARMVERLKDVEQHGYSPPPPEPEVEDVEEEEPEVAGAAKKSQQQDINEEEEEDDDSDEEMLELRATGTANKDKNIKKKKKKKKKGQQGDSAENKKVNNALAAGSKKNESAAQSKDSKGKEDDPLVAALLGMGFSEGQIHAAVKACGGTDRATADDLVMWILGEGAVEAAAAPAPAPAPRPEPPRKPAPPKPVKAPVVVPAPVVVQQPAPVSKPKAKEPPKVVLEARISTKESQAAIKLEEENRLKEQRLAQKREEKIRRNREWNERAQARQKEEEKAKIAQAVAEANRLANERAAQAAAAQQQQQLQQAHQQLQQRQQQQQQAQQQLQQHHQQQQHAKVSAAQQVLAPPSNYFPGGVNPSAAASMMPPHPIRAPPGAMSMPPPAPAGHYGMPMHPSQSAYPQGTAGNMLAAAGRMVDVQQAAHPQLHPQQYDAGNYNPLPPPGGMPKMQHQQSWEPPSSQGPMYNTEVSSQYPSIADDSTVSSYGSGRISAPSTFSAAVPPGFRQPTASATLPPPVEESGSVASFEVEENPLGEMRATAREFVPTNFGSRPSSRNATALRQPSSLSVGPTGSLSSTSEPPQTSRLPTFSGIDMSQTSTMPPSMPQNNNGGLLGGVNSFGSSILRHSQHQAQSLDRIMTPSSEHMSPVPHSSTSSVTGMANSEEPQFPSMLGLDKGLSDPATRTPVIMETLPSGLSSSSYDGNAGGASIWGGLSAGAGRTNANTTGYGTNANTTGFAGIPLAGLPSLSLTRGSSATASLGPRSDGMTSESVLPTGLGGVGGWGATNLSGNKPTGGGSIW